ncbi:MAG: GNAT family N-acetyltransferase [Candidatus Lokiarchaeota archaeon]|nr:GNAT family N-acetyltransferase [Candidatus Lokiarchaeota archaeon]
MLIRPFNVNTDKTKIIEVWNKVLKDMNPAWAINEEELDTVLVMEGDQTELSRDCLIAEDNKREINGFAFLLKSSKRDSWWLNIKVLPPHFKLNLLVNLFESILDQVNKQNAPQIRFTIQQYIFINSPLQIKFEEMGLKPVHYDFWMRMGDIDSHWKPNVPTGIKFQKQNELNDYDSYVEIINDAFSEHFDFRPYTEEEFKSIHKVSWKEYDVEYWFALEGNNPVGICHICINPEVKHVGTINTLGVLHSYHHNGIGSSLLGLGIQSLIEKGCTTIELGVEAKNEKALGLYKKFGFYEVESRTQITYTIK